MAQSRAAGERCLRGTGGAVSRGSRRSTHVGVRGLPRAYRVASFEPAVGRRRQWREVPSI
jgi:hypothetical protein